MLTREKVRPARHKTLILGHFEHAGRTFSRSHPPSDRAGRTFSRTRCDNVATLKPMTPLQPLIQASMKPPSPLQPKNAPKTPISHPQRRWGFQLRLALREQRRRRFHARDFQCTRAIAGPGRASIRRAEPHISDQAPLCGGRRRERRARLRHPRAMAGPGRGAGGRRQGQGGPRDRPLRAFRLACGDLAGGPPPTGAQSSPARRVRPDGTRNTSGATSNARTPERHSKRGRHQPTPCASALTHP